MSNNRISVVMRSRNEERWIGHALQSAIELIDNPELINNSPFEDGWMFRVQNINIDELNNLMEANEYL